jgi:hypothetical protein
MLGLILVGSSLLRLGTGPSAHSGDGGVHVSPEVIL